jgi:hypothetical protein
MRLALFSILLTAPCFASSFQISIDASSLPPATSGFIDFAFNGGYPATAVVSNFSNAGGLLNSGTITTFGTVSGTLPGMLTIGDDDADYDEGITYGTQISFLLTLSGTPSGTTGNVFTLSLFDTLFDGLLTGNTTDGWLVQFQMDTQGDIAADAFANPTGGPSFATVTAVPEPVVWPLAAALSFVFFFRHRTAIGTSSRVLWQPSATLRRTCDKPDA